VPPDLHVLLVSICGSAGPALLELADRADDLIVVGAGAQGRLARLFHSAAARYCVGVPGAES
jgi:nucleotide-binding universal stress UspA family protein